MASSGYSAYAKTGNPSNPPYTESEVDAAVKWLRDRQDELNENQEEEQESKRYNAAVAKSASEGFSAITPRDMALLRQAGASDSAMHDINEYMKTINAASHINGDGKTREERMLKMNANTAIADVNYRINKILREANI